MYLGKTNMIRDHKINFQCQNKLLDGTKCQILLDTGASKSFMFKLHYLCCTSLHSLPKFASKTQRIQVGNGQYISVLFVIPIIIDIHSHRFEIYTLVSEINDNADKCERIHDQCTISTMSYE